MKRLLPILLMALLVGACGSATPSESPSAANLPTVTVADYGCATISDVANLPTEIGTPAATATVETFVALNDGGIAGKDVIPAGYVSPFDGQKFYFHPDDWDAERMTAPSAQERGNFTVGSAGRYATGAVFVPGVVRVADPVPQGPSGLVPVSLSNLSIAYVDSAPLAITWEGRDKISAILTDVNNGGDYSAVFRSLNATATPPAPDGPAGSIGGIAVGADALYYELGSDVIALFDDYHTLPFDFPVLAIAHHPNEASAAAAVDWLTRLTPPAKQLIMCVGGVDTAFTVVDAKQMKIICSPDEACFNIYDPDGKVYAGDSKGHMLSLAIAQVTLGGEVYVIARAFRAEVTDESPEVPVYLSAAWGRNDEYRLAVWPNGTVAAQR